MSNILKDIEFIVEEVTDQQLRNIEKTFRAQLDALIKQAPDAVRMVITPERAKVMLERNSSEEWRNRPESESSVRRYAKKMEKGDWMYTGQTIIFSSTGNLLNGQHTLSACILSDSEFETLVAFGVKDEAFKYMDCGTSRTAAHIFAIDGVPCYVFASSVARLLYSYKNSNGNNPKGMKLENDELLSFFYDHQEILESKSIANTAQKSGLMTPAWAGFLHYLCAQKNRKMADDFFEKVLTGIGIESAKSPENMLRSRLIKNTQARADAKESWLYIGAYAIKAWNAKRKGATIGVLKWRSSQAPNEPYPRAI